MSQAPGAPGAPEGAPRAAERTLGALRAHARARLAGGDSPALDADLLLCHVAGCTRVDLLAHPERTLDDARVARLDALLARRAAGEPIAYLLGHREFHGLPFAVDARVLVPRPDTETLVDAVLEAHDAAPRTVLDLGTGSGAIALALANARPGWQVLASDRSPDALAVAHANAQRLGLPRVGFLCADWCAAFAAGCADIVASNPPYVATHDAVDDATRFEPASALYAGADGLDAIRAILADVPRVLRAGGALYLEHGAAQGEAVRALLAAAGFTRVRTLVDLSGRDRVTCGVKP